MPLGLVEPRGSTPWNAYEVAAIVVGPIVVRTDESACLAVFDLANPGAAVCTDIRDGMELTIVVEAQESGSSRRRFE
jgi:hypothetical protein